MKLHAPKPCARHKWAEWPTERLLDIRMCDLGLTIEGTSLEQRIQRVHNELECRGLTFKPHFWLSDEWFTPDGVPGVAIPFYIAHPRLIRLERKMMNEAEGSDRKTCMRILRHEVGHAIDNAYQLHRRRGWQKIFGKSSKPYPEYFLPQPSSRRFVHHLDYWYAQAHPSEDFAETFAIWLKPGGAWRKLYRDWPALKKVEYVASLMGEIAGQRPTVRSKSTVESVNRLTKTLRQHYAERLAIYDRDFPDRYDQDLKLLFSNRPEHRGNPSAATQLRRAKLWFRGTATHWSRQHLYAFERVVADMIGRCRQLNLRLSDQVGPTDVQLTMMLTMHTMEFMYRGRYWVQM